MDEQLRVLHGPFDIETHKATFRHYLEVVVFPDGKICYACPGHIEVMERYLYLKGGNPDACPNECCMDYDWWLMEQTGCVCVWTGGWWGKPNDAQKRAIDMLKDAGLLEVGE